MIADRECNYVCGALITFTGRRRQSPEPRTERVSSSSEELTFYNTSLQHVVTNIRNGARPLIDI